jgi:hypothetical protein
MLDTTSRKPWTTALELISIGNRWWFLPCPRHGRWFTIFLAPEAGMVRDVLDRGSKMKDFEKLEIW